MKTRLFKQNAKDFALNLLSILSLTLLIILWSSFSRTHGDYLPGPIKVAEKYISTIEHPVAKLSMFGHAWASLKRVLQGLLYAIIIGIPFGTMIGWNKTIRAIFQPIFELIRPIPPLAWVPLITVWFGIYETPKIILVFIGTFTAIVVNTYSGIYLAQKENLQVGRLFGAKKIRMVVDIVLPSALPSIMAGLKTALTTGWGVVLAAEMISANSGLGMLVTRGSDSDDIALVMVSIIFIGIIGALMSTVFTIIERKLSPWRTDLN